MFGLEERLDWPEVVLPRLIDRLLTAAQAAREKPKGRQDLYDRVVEALRSMDLPLLEREYWQAVCAGKPREREKVPDDLRPCLEKPLNAEGWNRMRLLVGSLADPAIGELVRQRCLEKGVGWAALLFAGFAAWAVALRLEVLLATPYRLEEFARKWADALGAPIAGETAPQSMRKLKEMDYGGSLATLEGARREREVRRRRGR